MEERRIKNLIKDNDVVRCNSTVRKKVAVNDGGPGSFEEYVRLQKEQCSVKDDGVQVQVQRDAPNGQGRRGKEGREVEGDVKVEGDIFSERSVASARGNFATRVFPKIYVQPCRHLNGASCLLRLLSPRRPAPARDAPRVIVR